MQGTFVDRLKSLQGDMKDADFSRKVGVKVQTLKMYDKGSSPSVDIAARIADACEVSLDWLAGRDVSQRGLAATNDNFIKLPQYDVNASAGRGEIAYAEHPISEISFERRFLRELGAQPDSCFIMWAKGDSMLPTFPDGAMLIVDQSQQVVDDGRIYVFNASGNLLVKRAHWRMDGRLELRSDNKLGDYPVETFERDRFNDLIVVGRVIWYGRAV